MYKHAKATVGLQSIGHGSLREATIVANGYLRRVKNLAYGAPAANTDALLNRLADILVGRGYSRALATRAARLVLTTDNVTSNSAGRSSKTAIARRIFTRSRKAGPIQPSGTSTIQRPPANNLMKEKLEMALRNSTQRKAKGQR